MKRFLAFLFCLLLSKLNVQALDFNTQKVSLGEKIAAVKTITVSTTENVLFWEDNSTNEDYSTRFYAAKFTLLESSVWKTPIELIPAKSSNIQSSHTLLGDNHGGFFIVWEEKPTVEADTKIFIQHIDSVGKKLFGPFGKQIAHTSGSQINPVITIASDNNPVVAWCDARNDLTSQNFDIYSQKFDSQGKSLWRENGELISADLHDEFIAKVISTDDGISIIWNKVITDPLSDGEGYDFYAQRLDDNGVRQLSLSPSIFLSLPVGITDYELIGDILDDTEGGFYLSLADGPDKSKFYLQHVSANGTSDWRGNYSPDGKISFQGGAKTALALDSAGMLVLTINGRVEDSIMVSTTLIDSKGEVFSDTTYTYADIKAKPDSAIGYESASNYTGHKTINKARSRTDSIVSKEQVSNAAAAFPVATMQNTKLASSLEKTEKQNHLTSPSNNVSALANLESTKSADRSFSVSSVIAITSNEIDNSDLAWSVPYKKEEKLGMLTNRGSSLMSGVSLTALLKPPLILF